MVQFTVRDVADSIEKNGIEQTTGYPFRVKVRHADYQDAGISYISHLDPSEKIVKACAIGQAFINLGTTDKWRTESLDLDVAGLVDTIIDLNDSHRLSFQTIADEIRKRYEELLDEVITAEAFDYRPYL